MKHRLCAGALAALLAGCASFADRFERGNANLSTGDGAVYLVLLSPILQNALNSCIPSGKSGNSPVIVLVADIDARGEAHDIDVEPDSAGTDCLADALTGRMLPRPPLAAGELAYPIGLKIENR